MKTIRNNDEIKMYIFFIIFFLAEALHTHFVYYSLNAFWFWRYIYVFMEGNALRQSPWHKNKTFDQNSTECSQEFSLFSNARHGLVILIGAL